MANRLIMETSPYLLQHATNPVHWYPWGEEAFNQAHTNGMPIFLSIGYSACHWCHVMEKESFSNIDIAKTMNEHFISIKVDREERPDIDSIYMTALHKMRGQGGWPLSMFITPSGQPFYGGTYFPPSDRHGLPGFSKVLNAVSEAYTNRPADVFDSAEQITSAVKAAFEQTYSSNSHKSLSDDTLHKAYSNLKEHFDPINGGFGSHPKFPQPMVLEFLLKYYDRTGENGAITMVTHTLDRMASGGIYDQIGGGFHRYSTDSRWLVPHFEKMLYDNALLARIYLHAFQTTHNPDYKLIAEEILDYVLREMTDDEGGFYSTQDADSEGEEGKFFLWTYNEIEQILGQNIAPILCSHLGVTTAGNFGGLNIPNVRETIEELAKAKQLSTVDLQSQIKTAKKTLLEARSRRVAPSTDTKILTSWNGLMLHSMALAGSILGREDYIAAAEQNAAFLLNNMRVQGRIFRSRNNKHSYLKGYLEDYASLADGLATLYEATLDTKWIEEALSIVDVMIELFWDSSLNQFFDTGTDHESLLVRPRDLMDNAMPSGTSIAVDILLRLATLTGNDSYLSKASSELKTLQEFMQDVPIGFGNWLGSLDFYLSSPKEIALIGPKESDSRQELMNVIFKGYLPNRIIAGYDPLDPTSYFDSPLLQDKPGGMVTTVYICKDYVCLAPVTNPSDLEMQLWPGETSNFRIII